MFLCCFIYMSVMSHVELLCGALPKEKVFLGKIKNSGVGKSLPAESKHFNNYKVFFFKNEQ